MRIAVVIVNWNAGQLLYNAVRSLYEQERLADRVLVVDNASTDNSLDSVRCFEELGLEILEADSNLGFAAANNIAIDRLKDCDWIALLNPDAVADKRWLQELEAAASQFNNAGSFASRMMSMDFTGRVDGIGDCYHIGGAAWRQYHGVDLVELSDLGDKPVFGACGGAAFYHRDTFIELGGFDEDFFCYMEDVDFAFRQQLSGKPCWYIHNAVVLHKGSGTTGNTTAFSDYHGHRNMIWTWIKNMPLPLLLVCLPVHVLVNLVMVIRSVPQGRCGPVVRGKLDAIKALPGLMQKRARIQSKATASSQQVWKLLDKSVLRGSAYRRGRHTGG